MDGNDDYERPFYFVQKMCRKKNARVDDGKKQRVTTSCVTRAGGSVAATERRKKGKIKRNTRFRCNYCGRSADFSRDRKGGGEEEDRVARWLISQYRTCDNEAKHVQRRRKIKLQNKDVTISKTTHVVGA